jgi:hypothetical protein
MILPAGTVATGNTRSTAALVTNCSGVQASFGVIAAVTWNGVNICGSTNQSAALSVDFTQTANLVYTWTTVGEAKAPSLTLNDARLQMFYFGFSIVTRDVTLSGAGPATNGTFDMNWNPGTLTYVFEGLFGLTASLLALNGTTVWSENFFVRATAPYSILAALPIVLIIIGIWELYSVARSGSQAALSTKGKPPAAPPPAPPAPESPTTASAGPPPASTEASAVEENP